MLRSDFPSWIFRLATLLSLSLLGLCIVGAVYLDRQQADTAESLGENIGSRRVARNLQVDLGTLVDAVRRRPEQVAEVDRKLERLIAQAQDLADKDEERRLVATIEDSYRRFKEHWRRRSAAASDKLAAEALAILETETLPACIQLVNFNADQIEAVRAAYGFKGNLLEQYVGYLWRLAHFDFGISTVNFPEPTANLLFYAAGLGVPFLLTGFAIGSARNFLRRISPALPYIEMFSGGLLVFIGILLVSNQLTVFNNYFDFFGLGQGL